jgi:hypothetical protein
MNYAPGFAQINRIALSQAVQFIPSRFSARARLFLIEGMIRANWQDGLVPTTRDILHLKRGQFVMGLKEMSEMIETSVGKLKTTMKQLKKVEEITCKGTNDGTIVTIMNYEAYTSSAGTDAAQDGKQTTNRRQL